MQEIEKAKIISKLLRVLSNENRLVIVCYLIEKPMTVSELHEKMSYLTQPALSQHLSILKANRILDSNKSGLTITYFIKDERIVNIIQVLKENYCK
ncbi:MULTISPECIES: ArsR/SmtB family transcription factor [Clostridium]|uniref:HTH-type transcriptional regulator YgaV n=3 Tax=Clostridium TaxID=1485 RepID=D8GPC3_CLOLD|nr:MULTISPECIES: metalloregulator ArsR/SmtB family transcription factor [Clostridium]ADK16001.1 transcriptional regulatory protein, ArsR family [Clostridium ljungdahlii DSM 13528]AGY75172.1 metalloregulator ArsR/SmtB family transcription factor [Clostridium autoethanogenum DSM 10061]ALU35344.1 Regulatory protein ArsR [Clostridium autoethanogenum DSM 10061]OAA87124.1 putative HTH-type transcriptional regulator YgaV [Clostridium ljungdahlii DSM 13528]OVY49577.1 putative HTH-type transcriptional 